MLGLPPAFVLSQDQTLKLKASEDAILDRRTSAHLSPGACPGNLLFIVLTRVSRQTVKLTLSSSVSLESRYASVLRSYDQTARISLQIATMSNSREKNQPPPPNLLANNSQVISDNVPDLPFQDPVSTASVPSVRPVQRVPPSGEGVFSPHRQTPQQENAQGHEESWQPADCTQKIGAGDGPGEPRQTPAPRISHRITTAK